MPDNCVKPARPIPEWINKSYFEKILTKDVPDFAKILEFVIVPATPSADNCSSLMVCVRMEIELEDGYTQRSSYVLKTMLDSGEGDNFANTLNLFPKERLMYEEILPKLERLYAEAGYDVKFAPECKAIDNISGRMAIVLEDLQSQRYRNVNRVRGFDVTHMKRVLQKLAEFHAASVVLNERFGPLPKQFQNSYLPANYHKSKSYKARVDSYKKAMALWGLNNYEKYAQCIPDAEQYVNAKMQCFSGEPDEFKVLNHGDFWSSNIMQRYTQDYKTGGKREINRIRFVDFQMCKWATPAIDLWQLIICSADINCRFRYINEFVYTYHTHLIKSLKFLESTAPVPTLKELVQNMIKHGFWAYFAAFNHLVLILMPPEKRINLTRLLQPDEEGDEARMNAFTNPLYVDAAKQILPFLHSNGILNFNKS